MGTIANRGWNEHREAIRRMVEDAPALTEAAEQLSHIIRFQGNGGSLLTHQLIAHQIALRETHDKSCAWHALVHDIAELVTGDISYWFKRAEPRVRKTERVVRDGILDGWGYAHDRQAFECVKGYDDRSALAEMQMFAIDPDPWSFNDLGLKDESLAEFWFKVPKAQQMEFWTDCVTAFGTKKPSSRGS